MSFTRTRVRVLLGRISIDQWFRRVLTCVYGGGGGNALFFFFVSRQTYTDVSVSRRAHSPQWKRIVSRTSVKCTRACDCIVMHRRRYTTVCRPRFFGKLTQSSWRAFCFFGNYRAQLQQEFFGCRWIKWSVPRIIDKAKRALRRFSRVTHFERRSKRARPVIFSLRENFLSNSVTRRSTFKSETFFFFRKLGFF